jgi:GDP-L-fucose synthase
VKEVVRYPGDIEFDITKPDGTPQKLLDVSRLTATGWRYRTDLRTGIENTYRWFLDNPESRRS